MSLYASVSLHAYSGDIHRMSVAAIGQSGQLTTSGQPTTANSQGKPSDGRPNTGMYMYNLTKKVNVVSFCSIINSSTANRD